MVHVKFQLHKHVAVHEAFQHAAQKPGLLAPMRPWSPQKTDLPGIREAESCLAILTRFAAAPALVAVGPRLPTYTEATSALDENELTVDRRHRLFRPSAAIDTWIEDSCQRLTPEGPRAGTADFWLRRPSCLLRPSFTQNSN